MTDLTWTRVTAFGLGLDQAERIVRWSHQAARREQARGPTGPDDGGAASGDPLALLAVLDQLPKGRGR